MAVISFHSLEDRQVKRFFAELARGCVCPPELPVCVCGHEPEAELVTRRAVRPSEDEVADNPRAAVGPAARRDQARRRIRPPSRKEWLVTPPPTTAPARAPARRTTRKPVRATTAACPGPRGRPRAPAARAVAAPRPLPRSPFGPLADRAAEAVCTVRDSPLVDRLVRGQGWIALLGVLLIGLVGLNVSLLKLNAQNGRSAEVARDLRIQNAKLRGSVSRLGSSDRLQEAARNAGLVMPTPQMVNYLTAHPRSDGRRAAKNVRLEVAAPTEEQLVSASPEAERELAAPTPSQPIVEEPAPAPRSTVATGATGTAGATAPTGAPAGATGATGPAGTPGG